jgi:hypothetical protein
MEESRRRLSRHGEWTEHQQIRGHAQIAPESLLRQEQAAEKPKFLLFRGTLLAEESLILLILEPTEIPHFVRNHKIDYFLRRVKKPSSEPTPRIN